MIERIVMYSMNLGQHSRLLQWTVYCYRRIMCETYVSQCMSADADDADEGTEKIDVRVPARLLQRIDEEYERRGYTSRSEAVRDALRDWINPPVTLSKETLDDLEESRKQAEQGETVSAEEAREQLGLDD